MDSTSKPCTSKCDKTPEKDDDENELKQKRKEEMEELRQSLHNYEREKKRNVNKIRLRRPPSFLITSSIRTVIETMNIMFSTDLTPEDVVECISVPSWTEPEESDLLLTFINDKRRNHVYNNRTKENRGYITICDELGAETLSVWQKLVQKYDTERVYTHSGGVMLDLDGKTHRFITERDFKKFEESQNKLEN